MYSPEPSGKREYLMHYGHHFSKKAYLFAVKRLYKEDASGNEVKVKPYTKDEIDELLAKCGVKLSNDEGYDAAYVASMAKADYFGSSIEDEQHLAKFVSDFLDDADGGKEKAFRHWYADMIEQGVPIIWEDIM